MRVRQRELRRRQAQQQSLGGWSKRRVLSWSLFVLAAAVGVNHLFAHAGARVIPMGMGKQDLLLGYPMAGVLFLCGLFMLDPNPRL